MLRRIISPRCAVDSVCTVVATPYLQGGDGQVQRRGVCRAQGRRAEPVCPKTVAPAVLDSRFLVYSRAGAGQRVPAARFDTLGDLARFSAFHLTRGVFRRVAVFDESVQGNWAHSSARFARFRAFGAF